jgi:hypothetical protein
MHYANNEDQLSRVRNILNIMDRSIDAARARRESPDDLKSVLNQGSASETRPSAMEQGEARLPTSMFDRNGPRLKARPKRSND